jgi:uncharacterized phage infection (PIP) family protein YhgE
MIAKHYIETGNSIRTEFRSISNKLNSLLSDLSKIGNSLKEENDGLKNIYDNLSTYKDPDSAKKDILNKLSDIEKQGNKLSALYKPLNERLEELKKQEEILYVNIKSAYPNLSDEEIIEEFKEK